MKCLEFDDEKIVAGGCMQEKNVSGIQVWDRLGIYDENLMKFH